LALSSSTIVPAPAVAPVNNINNIANISLRIAFL
jgi:hypothetical protein